MSNTVTVTHDENFVTAKVEITGECPNYTEAIEIGIDAATSNAAMAMRAATLQALENSENDDNIKVIGENTIKYGGISCTTKITIRVAGVTADTLTHIANKAASDTNRVLSESAHVKEKADDLLDSIVNHLVNGDLGDALNKLKESGLGDVLGMPKVHFFGEPNRPSDKIPDAAFMTASGDGPWG